MALSSCSCRSRFPERFKLLLAPNGATRQLAHSRANCEMDKLNDVIIVHISLHSRRRHRSLRLFSFFLVEFNKVVVPFRALPSKYLSICFIKIYVVVVAFVVDSKESNAELRPKMLQYLQFHSIEQHNFISFGAVRISDGGRLQGQPVGRPYTMPSCFNGVCCSFSTMQSKISSVMFFPRPAHWLTHSPTRCLLILPEMQTNTHTHPQSTVQIFSASRFLHFKYRRTLKRTKRNAACLNRFEKHSLISRIHANHFISQFSTFPNCLLYCLVSSRCEPTGLLSHLRFDSIPFVVNTQRIDRLTTF